MKTLLLLLLAASTAFAQFPADHAAIYSPTGTVPSSVEQIIASHGGRIAVKSAHTWVVRIPETTALELRRAFPDVQILRTAADLNQYPQTAGARGYLTELFPGAHRMDKAEAGFPGFGDDIPHSCLTEEEESDPLEVRKAMKTQLPDALFDFDPNKTSDVLPGTTTLAVMCVNNTLAGQQGVPTWTQQIYDKAIGNILVNLAWWSDQAEGYGKTATFTVREYKPEIPVCAIDFDPTEGYTHTSFSVNDYKFQIPLMQALGYSGTNRTTMMRAFCNDLRTDEGTDWAYIAFLLVGKNSVRAHASFGGPSTVLMATQTGNGYVFAHETGHIYNAFDEYFEATFSAGRARQSRFGVPNGNHHFRNYPVQPCIMAGNYRALSEYTAVFLGLTESVRFTTVESDPPGSSYEVSYISPEGTASHTARYQGDVQFAWGNGTKVRLSGLNEIAHSGKKYTAPVWGQSGSSQLTVAVDNAIPQSIGVSYAKTETPAEQTFEYLTLGNALASEFVYGILPLGERSAAFCGNKGISLWDGTDKVILDHPFSERGLPVFRQSYSAAAGPSGELVFGSDGGELLVWQHDSIAALTGPDKDMLYRTVAVSTDGAVWATDGGTSGGRDMEGSGLHRFYQGAVTVFTTTNAPLPSNNISSIAPEKGGAIWLGMSGKDLADQGLYVFDPATMTLTDKSDLIAGTMVPRLRTVGLDSLLVISKAGDASGSEQYIDLIAGAGTRSWDASYFTSVGTMNDATIGADGRLAIATTNGVGILEADESWTFFRMANSEMPSNTCYSIVAVPGGGLIVGTNNGAALISPAGGVVSVPGTAVVPERISLHTYPNPANGTLHAEFTAPGLASVLSLYNTLGQPVHTATLYGTGAQAHTVDVASLPAGMYFLRITSGTQSASKIVMVGR